MAIKPKKGGSVLSWARQTDAQMRRQKVTGVSGFAQLSTSAGTSYIGPPRLGRFLHPLQLGKLAAGASQEVAVKSGKVNGPDDETYDGTPEIDGAPLTDFPAPKLSLGSTPAEGVWKFWVAMAFSSIGELTGVDLVITEPGDDKPEDVAYDPDPDDPIDGLYHARFGFANVNADNVIDRVENDFRSSLIVTECGAGMIVTETNAG